MSSYLLIETREPFDGREAQTCYGLATELAQGGSDVALFLIENGVLPARAGAASGLDRLVADEVRILADEFSLSERGIDIHRLENGIEPADISEIIDALVAGAKAIWH
ncbi:MAG: DsrE family protein [Deltaproteobacteria bacterium]|nr:DsrE family protein [Deltaproteobacteria bacterium]